MAVGLSAIARGGPVRYANQLPQQVESLIVTLKRDKPHWGARKIHELLLRRLASHIRVPAKSTIHGVLDRHGLVKRMGKRRPHATGTPLSQGTAPNDLWCADYKSELLMKTLPKVATEMALCFLTYNLTRVLNIVGVPAVLEAIKG
jgi:hypothetical protein